MNKFNNFMIYLNNLSDIYILSIVTIFSAVGIAFYCAKCMNKQLNQKNPEIMKNPDLVHEESETDQDDNENNIRGLVGKLKSARLKKIEDNLTNDQIEEEKKIEQEQLAAIFELLKKQQAEFDVAEMNENELKQQLNLYR